ncbi:MAG: cardiolipin synthase [Planctomycetota bacterium]
MRFLSDSWPYITAILSTLVSLTASGHAILYKRDVRAALGWVGIIWLAPFVGSLLYFLFGINRIRRRAHALRVDSDPPPGETVRGSSAAPDAPHLNELARLVGKVTEDPLLAGNSITVLKGGTEAYPEMIHAISSAKHSVALSSYIFNYDKIGEAFVSALKDAVDRGVEVRVLVDAVGSRYRSPNIVSVLERKNVRAATFLPSVLPWRFHYANLRNHRKILVVDGRTAFTGGMNIQEENAFADEAPDAVRDTHFRVTGPVVTQLQRCFATDWAFTEEETLSGEAWFPEPKASEPGQMICRTIPDGPDEDLDKLRWTLLGALATARSSITIITPYFLPDTALITALNVAAMKGVRVDIILPEKGNLRLVQWASTAQLWQVVERGCHVWLAPPPFDHSKILVIDEHWSLLGSANWDPRSLRLNFEVNVECYDRELAAELEEHARVKRDVAREVGLEELDGRPLPTRLRDGIARLFSPYI